MGRSVDTAPDRREEEAAGCGRNKYMATRVALYPGSFDPLHNGHLDVIERVSRIFDEVVVVVFINSAKRALFAPQERMQMVDEATRHLSNVRVDHSSDLLVRYAARVGAHVIVRGLRAVLDFDYEFQIALMNKRMAADIDTLFILTGEHYSYLSSTIVKELASYGADVTALVPPAVVAGLQEKFRAREGLNDG